MKKLFLVLMMVLTPTATLAYLEKYGPFKPGQEPIPFRLRECICLQSTNDDIDATQVFAVGTNATHRIVVTPLEKDGYGYTVKIVESSGKNLLNQTKIEGALIGGVTIRWAFLNRDEHPDYVRINQPFI